MGLGTAKASYVTDWVKPSLGVLTLAFRHERQSARMSKITNDGLTWSGAGCFIAVHATVSVNALGQRNMRQIRHTCLL